MNITLVFIATQLRTYKGDKCKSHPKARHDQFRFVLFSQLLPIARRRFCELTCICVEFLLGFFSRKLKLTLIIYIKLHLTKSNILFSTYQVSRGIQHRSRLQVYVFLSFTNASRSQYSQWIHRRQMIWVVRCLFVNYINCHIISIIFVSRSRSNKITWEFHLVRK